MNKYKITIVILLLFIIYLLIINFLKEKTNNEMERAFAMNAAWMAEKEINLKVQAMVDFNVVNMGDVKIQKIDRSPGRSGIEISGNEKAIAAIRSYIKDNITEYNEFNNAGISRRYFNYIVTETPSSLIFEYVIKVGG